MDVKDCLSQFGEVKGDVITLKYKADHDLAGIENGNRLVKMVLGARSIPYLMKIGGEWCRVIHNNQQPVCIECHEEGHTRKKCPQIECRICKEKGHMSYICDKKKEQHGDDLNPVADDAVGNSAIVQDVEISGKEKVSSKVDSEKIAVSGNDVEDMDSEENVQGCKRQHSDSDSGFVTVRRRQRLNPVPNVSCAKPRTEKLISIKVDNGKTLSDS